MSRKRTHTRLMLTLGAALIASGGCASNAPTEFYVLAPLTASESGDPGNGAEQSIAIGVGPVELPDYLDRPQIVTRGSGNKLEVAEFNHWAEPLKDNVLRVLAEDLSTLIPTDRVAMYPWRRATPVDYQIAVEITRFDGVLGGESSLQARWSISDEAGKALVVRKSSFSESAATQDYNATVAAMNRTVEQFTREIASAIKSIQP